MRIGIFGGTFDPPHLGHLILASDAVDQLGLKKVLWVLTHKPPHKDIDRITPIQHRLDMVLAAINDEPRFILSRVDIDRCAPHYAVDSVRLIQKDFPSCEMVYLMGGDSIMHLPSWYRPLKFIQICPMIGVMNRPGSSFNIDYLEKKIPGIADKIYVIDTPVLDISASQIRNRINSERPYRYFLPPTVYEIINSRHLYHGKILD